MAIIALSCFRDDPTLSTFIDLTSVLQQPTSVKVKKGKVTGLLLPQRRTLPTEDGHHEEGFMNSHFDESLDGPPYRRFLS